MIKRFWIVSLIVLLSLETAYAWNSVGHRLVAQIAYNHLSSTALQKISTYNQSLDKVYKPENLISAATWLDRLRYQDINWFAAMHYVDLPFSEDGSPLPKPAEINALWAIENASKLLRNRYASNFDKGIGLRVLLHVTGDLHQPLHAATRVSRTLSQGDRGGNLYLLKANPIAHNLHSYWDKGGGAFSGKYSSSQIKRMAERLELQWPCNLEAMDINPTEWANESHHIAISMAYRFPINETYEKSTYKISQQRVALAGCRLAHLLNTITTV